MCSTMAFDWGMNLPSSSSTGNCSNGNSARTAFAAHSRAKVVGRPRWLPIGDQLIIDRQANTHFASVQASPRSRCDGPRMARRPPRRWAVWTRRARERWSSVACTAASAILISIFSRLKKERAKCLCSRSSQAEAEYETSIWDNETSRAVRFIYSEFLTLVPVLAVSVLLFTSNRNCVYTQYHSDFAETRALAALRRYA